MFDSVITSGRLSHRDEGFFASRRALPQAP
jgi:hypothetical protein